MPIDSESRDARVRMTAILTPEEVEAIALRDEFWAEGFAGDRKLSWCPFAASLESAVVAKLAAKAGELPRPHDMQPDADGLPVALFTDDQLASHTAAMAARVEVQERALRGVIAVADRKTDEFDAARAALFPAKKD